MAAVVGLGGFALFGLLTGLVFRRFFRARRLGLGRLILLVALLNAVALYGFVLTVTIFTIGPDEVASNFERAVLKIGVWPAFAVVALWAYARKTRTRVMSHRIVSPPGVVLMPPPMSDVQPAPADAPPPAPPPAPLPQPF